MRPSSPPPASVFARLAPPKDKREAKAPKSVFERLAPIPSVAPPREQRATPPEATGMPTSGRYSTAGRTVKRKKMEEESLLDSSESSGSELSSTDDSDVSEKDEKFEEIVNQLEVVDEVGGESEVDVLDDGVSGEVDEESCMDDDELMKRIDEWCGETEGDTTTSSTDLSSGYSSSIEIPLPVPPPSPSRLHGLPEPPPTPPLTIPSVFDPPLDEKSVFKKPYVLRLKPKNHPALVPTPVSISSRSVLPTPPHPPAK